MVEHSGNPGWAFWLYALAGIPCGAVAIVWAVSTFWVSAPALLGAVAVLLVAAAAVAWHLPRLRAMAPAARLTWALAGAGIGAGATVAWVAVALVVALQLACGGGGCAVPGAD